MTVSPGDEVPLQSAYSCRETVGLHLLRYGTRSVGYVPVLWALK